MCPVPKQLRGAWSIMPALLAQNRHSLNQCEASYCSTFYQTSTVPVVWKPFWCVWESQALSAGLQRFGTVDHWRHQSLRRLMASLASPISHTEISFKEGLPTLAAANALERCVRALGVPARGTKQEPAWPLAWIYKNCELWQLRCSWMQYLVNINTLHHTSKHVYAYCDSDCVWLFTIIWVYGQLATVEPCDLHK